MAISPLFKEIDDASFTENVTKSKGIVVLEFYRDSCSSCRVFEATLNEFADLYKGQMTFLRLSTDTGRFHYDRLECGGDPTCVVFFDGEDVDSYRGASPLFYFQSNMQRIFKRIAEKHNVREPLPVRT